MGAACWRAWICCVAARQGRDCHGGGSACHQEKMGGRLDTQLLIWWCSAGEREGDDSLERKEQGAWWCTAVGEDGDAPGSRVRQQLCEGGD